MTLNEIIVFIWLLPAVLQLILPLLVLLGSFVVRLYTMIHRALADRKIQSPIRLQPDSQN